METARLPIPALRFLLVGTREEDYLVVRDSLRKAELDHVDCLEGFKRCLQSGNYDLVLLLCEADDELATAVVHELDTLGQKIPFLFLTDSTDHLSGTKPMEAGGWDCVEQLRLRQRSLLQAIRNAISIHRAEQENRVAQEMLRKLSRAVEQSADIVVITDRAGVIEYVNPAFEKLTGYSRAEAVGQTPRILKSGEQVAQEYRRLWTTILAGEVYRGTMINRKKNGEFYVAEKTVTPVRNSEDEITHFISNDRDITDRRRLETALFQAQKMDAIGQLAGGVAHDFNNLLLVISSYAELMLDTIGPEHHLHRHVEEILGATRRAADLTRQLLAFSRKQLQSLKVIDLNTVLQEIGKILPRLIGENIAVIMLPGADLGKVKVDPVQVEQVVMNLATNARDAMAEGGTLTIRTSQVEFEQDYAEDRFIMPRGSYTLLQVSDTGAGIAPQHLPHIFEPFFTTKEAGKGTGLGLATVYGIVKQNNGFICVSGEPGAGTTFRIYLPRVEERVLCTAQPESADASDLRGSETILLVEDEEAVRYPAVEFLKRCGYTVIEAGNGEQAIEVASQHKGDIHLLLTDMVMPGMSGAQAARVLAAAHPTMKVLFVSGYAEKSATGKDARNFPISFLQKPFMLKELAQTVRKILDPEQKTRAASAS